MLITDPHLGKIAIRTVPLAPYMKDCYGTYTYSGKILVSYKTDDDIRNKDWYNVVTVNDDGSDMKKVFTGEIKQLEKANGIRWMCFADNKRILLGDYVLECTPDIDNCEKSELIPVIYPDEFMADPMIFRHWSEIVIAPDNIHMSWTTLSIGGAVNYLGKITRKKDEYVITDICVISSTKPYKQDEKNEGFMIPLPVRGGEVKQFIHGGKALTMVGNGDSITESVVQPLDSDEIIQITDTPGYEETTIFSFDEKLGVVMSPRFSRKTNCAIFGLVPQPHSMPVRGNMINILYMYSVAGVRAFRKGNVGPVLIDIQKSKQLKRAYEGVNLSDPEGRWVYYSPISWHPDGKRALWNERTRLSEREPQCRLRMFELLDYKPGRITKIEPTPECSKIPYAKPYPLSEKMEFDVEFPVRIKGKVSGMVENGMIPGTVPVYTAIYDNFSDDGKSVYEGYISVTTPKGLFTPGKTVFEADLTVKGEHNGHMKLRAVFNRQGIHSPAMLSFDIDESGLPESRGFATYDGTTLKMEDMEP